MRFEKTPTKSRPNTISTMSIRMSFPELVPEEGAEYDYPLKGIAKSTLFESRGPCEVLSFGANTGWPECVYYMDKVDPHLVRTKNYFAALMLPSYTFYSENM